ncbi:MAG TPA: rhomboid family intramembrane serine protease [Thermoanaerobaculia bacterium]|nr:rhomboid family intramembrane serine protease [Thermoanaerobaculia bacterium]
MTYDYGHQAPPQPPPPPQPQLRRVRPPTPVTRALLIIIAIVFAFEYAADLSAFHGQMRPSEFIAANIDDSNPLLLWGAIRPPLVWRGELWRLVTAMFLHGSTLHIGFNAWALYQLGSLYEVMFGSRRFAFIYFATGLCASVASSLHIHGASVGASGAIFGVLGAFIFSIRRSPRWRRQSWTRGLLMQLVLVAIVNIIIGFSVTFIDNAAHIAGLVSGLLFGLIPTHTPPPAPRESIIEVMPYEG